MDDKLKTELWLRYSSVWRNVLSRVLEWPPERVDSYIEELKRQMKARINDPFDFGFFYDPPSRYLVRPILGDWPAWHRNSWPNSRARIVRLRSHGPILKNVSRPPMKGFARAGIVRGGFRPAAGARPTTQSKC